ncbi:uncharacterized protein LOC100240848 isoform X4 [Vitis vinifera]|uniref:uncharacterized protein LOC100240848 isoform X4 n=1 Tax=Vitis vinifera TaxID=29760 RepID=UPI002883443A|nr:uncharacterized protein LOC100240848 isoform X4 [Vitis vinifera]
MVVHFQIYLAASDLSIVRCLGHCFSATGAGNEGRASFGALRSSKLGIASIWMERTEVIQGPPFIQCSLFSSFSNGNCCKTLDLS